MSDAGVDWPATETPADVGQGPGQDVGQELGSEAPINGPAAGQDAPVLYHDAAGQEVCGADPASVEPALREFLGQTGPFQPGQVTELEVPGLCPTLGFRIFEVRFLQADGLAVRPAATSSCTGAGSCGSWRATTCGA